jgi:hypothetical protein
LDATLNNFEHDVPSTINGSFLAITDVRNDMNDEIRPRRWWMPSPLVAGFFALVVIDFLLLWWVSGDHYTGSDAAGNGMANGFGQFLLEIEGGVVAGIAFLFLVIWHRGIRLFLLGLLIFLNLALLSIWS